MLEDWGRAFPGCEPLAYRMRGRLPARWVRFHSLPDSKRYPDDEDEFAVILGRQNRILGELLGPGTQAVLLTTSCIGPSGVEAGDDERLLREIDPDAKPWRSLAMHELEEDFIAPTYWHVLASEWTWRPGAFDPVFRSAAMNQIVNVMILPPDCRWLFLPYDGGVDLILESSAERDRIRAAYAGWSSSRLDGL